VRLPLVPFLVGCLVVAGCGGDEEERARPATETSARPAATAAGAPAPGCRAVRAPEAKGEQRLDKPTERLDPRRSYIVRLVTNCGRIDIRLAVRRAPKTTASVAHLVRRGFYDGLTFHRIAHDEVGGDFVILGGYPLGTGRGGPGYQITEKPPSSLRYRRGVVAMAKADSDPPGTSGSQFFIVTAEDTPLSPDYALVGTVAGGDDVVSRIAAAKTGPPPLEPPRSPIVIERAQLVTR
jgi:peptidyl-prolyl cis-trans isomerase B (cyclophilin B)